MADSRRSADDVLALALASGKRVEDAALVANVSTRTASRRLQEPDFVARIRQLRAAMLDAVVGRLAERSCAAADRLAGLLDSPDENLVFKTAKTVVELALKGREILDLEQRIAALEVSVDQQKDGSR
jgi:hypothetical protein